MKFCDKMIRLRKRYGYTQETFAQEVGVSRQSVYKWENGTSYPEVEKLLKIARTLSITVDDLLNEEMGIDENGIARRMTEEEAAAVKVKRVKREKAEKEEASTEETAPAAAEEEKPVEEEPVAESAKEVEEAQVAAPASQEMEQKEAPKKRGFFGLFRRNK